MANDNARLRWQVTKAFHAGLVAGWLAGLVFFLMLVWADTAGVL
jgi:hypothetical protein